MFLLLNSHVTVQQAKIVLREVRYCATKNGPKKVLGFVVARQTRSLWFIILIAISSCHNTGRKSCFKTSAVQRRTQSAYSTFSQFISFPVKQAFSVLGI